MSSIMRRRSDEECLKRIAEIEEESKPWVEEDYEAVYRMMRAQIKGIYFAMGKDYSIAEGKVINEDN